MSRVTPSGRETERLFEDELVAEVSLCEPWATAGAGKRIERAAIATREVHDFIFI